MNDSTNRIPLSDADLSDAQPVAPVTPGRQPYLIDDAVPAPDGRVSGNTDRAPLSVSGESGVSHDSRDDAPRLTVPGQPDSDAETDSSSGQSPAQAAADSIAPRTDDHQASGWEAEHTPAEHQTTEQHDGQASSGQMDETPAPGHEARHGAACQGCEMTDVVAGKTRSAGPVCYYLTEGQLFDVGDAVMVETDSGPALIHVMSVRRLPLHRLESEECGSVGVVIGPASQADCSISAANLQLAGEAKTHCRQCIRERDLDMKLVDVEVTHDKSKIAFYFTAPARIDFRELVKDLVRKYRTRIELRQIGVRHETQMVGAIGNCGMVCCCRRYLRTFAPVAIKMAKEQNIFLNPAKISGICGRLLCCLAYEQENYDEFYRRCPKLGKKYQTSRGAMRVLRASLFRESVTVLNETNEELEFTLEEWKALDPNRNDNGGNNGGQGQDQTQERRPRQDKQRQPHKTRSNASSDDADADELSLLEDTTNAGRPAERSAGQRPDRQADRQHGRPSDRQNERPPARQHERNAARPSPRPGDRAEEKSPRPHDSRPGQRPGAAGEARPPRQAHQGVPTGQAGQPSQPGRSDPATPHEAGQGGEARGTALETRPPRQRNQAHQQRRDGSAPHDRTDRADHNAKAAVAPPAPVVMAGDDDDMDNSGSIFGLSPRRQPLTGQPPRTGDQARDTQEQAEQQDEKASS